MVLKRINPLFKNIVIGFLDESKHKLKIKFAYFKENPNKKELLDFFIYCLNKLGHNLDSSDISYIKNNLNGKFKYDKED